MMELLTTSQAAEYLRLKERKLYELVAEGAIPCTKVTGRWLFPRGDLDRWLRAGLNLPAEMAQSDPPPIIGGSHDPLLEWAMRESGCGLAILAEGSGRGLARLDRREVVAAAIHMHALGALPEEANIQAVRALASLHDVVLIGFLRRRQGFLVAPGNPHGIGSIEDIARSRARIALRPAGAGAQLLLLVLLQGAGLSLASLARTERPCPTGTDLAQAVKLGQADCGIATQSVAVAAGLDFVPLAWEYFDLVMRQRDYFQPTLQTLLRFLATPAFAAHARELTGYDLSALGTVRFAA